MRLLKRLSILSAMLVCALAGAQEKGQPGKFDFYLLKSVMVPGVLLHSGHQPPMRKPTPASSCTGCGRRITTAPIRSTVRTCPAPAHPDRNLDITPDLALLAHEWEKHGTCTTLAPDAFFALEHRAFHRLAIPKLFAHIERETQMKPAEIIDLFAMANPNFPRGSILVSCGNNRLTAIEACFSKDGLTPIACRNLRECHARTVKISPATTAR